MMVNAKRVQQVWRPRQVHVVCAAEGMRDMRARRRTVAVLYARPRASIFQTSTTFCPRTQTK